MYIFIFELRKRERFPHGNSADLLCFPGRWGFAARSSKTFKNEGLLDVVTPNSWTSDISSVIQIISDKSLKMSKANDMWHLILGTRFTSSHLISSHLIPCHPDLRPFMPSLETARPPRLQQPSESSDGHNVGWASVPIWNRLQLWDATPWKHVYWSIRAFKFFACMEVRKT